MAYQKALLDVEAAAGAWRTIRKGIGRVGTLTLLAPMLGVLLLVGPSAAQTPEPKYPDFPSETPAKLVPVTDSFDYVRRDVMIPMRDGVKLHTVILIPKGAKRAPILLTRTPYDAKSLTSHAESSHLGPVLEGYDNVRDVIIEGGYIRVVQDVRGKYGSEGDYVMNRPLRGPQNPTPVDHSTDRTHAGVWIPLHRSLFVAGGPRWWSPKLDPSLGPLDNARVARIR